MDNIYKTVLDDALGAYWDYNFQTEILYVSPEFKKNLGYEETDQDNSKDTWREKVFPEDLMVSNQILEEHIRSYGQTPYRVQARYHHKNGNVVWMQSTGRVMEWTEDGKPIRMVGCHFDITKQKELELQLKDTETFLTHTNEVARVGGWEVDLKNNTVLWQNVTRQIHEVPDDYIPDLQTAIRFYKEGECRDKIQQVVNDAIQKGIRYEVEAELITYKGRSIWVRAIGHPEFEEGKCIRLTGIIQDIDKQKKIEEELRTSEEQFRNAFEFSANGMALVSTTGKWLKVNQKLCDIVGYTETELLQKTFQDITHPEDVEADVQMVKKTLKEGIKNVQREKRYVHKNGKEVWVLLNISSLKNFQGSTLHFITQVQDITERKSKEKQILKVNRELTALFDSDAHISILAVDLNGLITHFSKGAEILLGYSKEEALHKMTLMDIHVDQEVEERSENLSAQFGRSVTGFDAMVELARQGQDDSQSWTYSRKDGSTFTVQVVVTAIKNETGAITGFLVIGTDISPIIATKEALKESEQRWQFALDGSNNGVWDWNMVSNEVFYSKKWKTIIGYEEEEIPNTYEAWSTRVHPEDLSRCQKDLEMHYTGFTPDYVNEHRLLCKDGTYKWILSRGKVIEWTKDHKPVRIMGTHTDISWQKEKEEELGRTLDIISEQNKRLLNFAHIVSHNLRSHSGNFKLLLDVMEVSETEQEKAEATDHLKDIYQSLDETIKNLNEIVKIQTNIIKQKEELNLNHYIEKTTDLLRGEINLKQVVIHNHIPADTFVHYNPAYIESILLNFFTNAIKYSHPDRRPEIHLSIQHQNDRLVLAIADNGLGIDLHKHGKRLFGMYKTFHGNDDAKGIGLFITKNQVDAMGGKIEVESEVNKGSTFKIFFS